MTLKRLLAVVVCCFAASTSGFGADLGDFTALERQFRELPMDARRLVGPLFWLHGDESRERLEMYIEKIAEGGNGCFTTESRPHRDWLGPDWFRDLDICLQAAKKHDLKMWIFDEQWWPSQGVGGRVPPEYAAKRLAAEAVDVEGPKQFTADGHAGPRYIATVAGQITADGKLDATSLTDLAPFIKGGKLEWQPPAGRWRIIKFHHVQAPALSQNQQLSVDGASRDCVDWFIQTVYQPHYDRFKDDFGKTILGFFYDEPETRGDWGTELNTVLAEWNVDWKKAYVAYKFELAGEEQTAAKYQYLEAFAEAWGRTMYGGMAQWCRKRGVKSIGHFMEHGNLYRNPTYCAGDMMRLQRYSDMGGIDAVFDQFIMGKREEGRDAPIWQTPKLASSISHVFGKPDDLTMIEIFGARGQDLTYREMKWWTDHMQVSGVNFMIPHSFNPRAPYDRDCPPYFYNGGFEPRWPLYRVWADYTNRLSLFLTGGRHVCPVAVLFSGNLGQVGKMIGPEAITTALQDAQLDCDWLPMDVFEREAKISDNEIQLHAERYKVLIVPPVEAIPYDTLAKVKEFFDRGGIVVGYGFLPSKSAAIGKTNNDIAKLCRAIWGENATNGEHPAGGSIGKNAIRHNHRGGKSCFLADLGANGLTAIRALVAPTLQVVKGETDNWLHVLHRRKAERDVFLICNQNHAGPAREFLFQATAQGVPEIWDPMRNTIVAVPYRQIDSDKYELVLVLEPLETVLLVFQPQKIERPMRIGPDVKPLREPIALARQTNPAVETPMPDMTRKPLTLSPVKAADPFRGRATIPADVNLQKCRVFLEMDDLPDEAAAITVNGTKAGGLIGRPLRLDITRHVKPGENEVLIEPLAPKSARLVVYP